MSITTVSNSANVPDSPQGHVIGYVDSPAQCDAIVTALIEAGIKKERIIALNGEEGLGLLRAMMEGSQWGEEAEVTLRQSEHELVNGSYVLCIDAEERDDALSIAKIAQQHGGYRFNHFGILVDETLTP